MNVVEILTEVKSDIRQTGEGGFTDTQLLALLNEGYVDFCRFTECREKSTEIVTEALHGSFETPSDFLESRQYRWSYNRQIFPRAEVTLDDDDSNEWEFRVADQPDSVVYFNWKNNRLYPIPSSAGTVLMRHAFIPDDLTLADTPDIPKVYHDALVDYVDSECLFIMRDFTSAADARKSYDKRRLKARSQSNQGQRTPNTLVSQRPVTVFNYKSWDYRYRKR